MDSVLSSSEIEFYIDTMSPQKIENIASKTWLDWHQRLQKLHQEAIIEASQVKEEHVKETLVSFQKVPVLVHEAILISVWKNKILPIILRICHNSEGSFMAYSVLYHEAVVVGLLELVMYHGNGSEALQESALDLLDYAYEACSKLLVIQYKDDPLTKKDLVLKEKGNDEIQRHKTNIAFEIGIKALTILRYLADHMDRLSLGVTSKIFETYDVPVLLIQMLLVKPWLREGKQYISSKWIEWDGEVVAQAEAQVWLAIRQLLLDPACTMHYPITESRLTQILKLRPLITPVLLDQISPLIELQQVICNLAMSKETTKPSKPVLVESIPQIKLLILKSINNKCKEIAMEHAEIIFTKDHGKLVEMAQSLNEAYNMDLMENLEGQCNAQPCTRCRKDCVRKCSQCKEKWYCSRSCQVEDWPNHKVECLNLTNPQG